MAEYISREMVLKKLQMQLLDLEADQDKGEYSELCANRGARDAIDEAIYDIRIIKAVDIQPVKHGRWIDHEKFERNNCNACIECSVCNTWFGHDCIPKTKYCPNCGARLMKGEK